MQVSVRAERLPTARVGCKNTDGSERTGDVLARHDRHISHAKDTLLHTLKLPHARCECTRRLCADAALRWPLSHWARTSLLKHMRLLLVRFTLLMVHIF